MIKIQIYLMNGRVVSAYLRKRQYKSLLNHLNQKMISKDEHEQKKREEDATNLTRRDPSGPMRIREIIEGMK